MLVHILVQALESRCFNSATVLNRALAILVLSISPPLRFPL